jgi:hypothetical protein
MLRRLLAVMLLVAFGAVLGMTAYGEAVAQDDGVWLEPPPKRFKRPPADLEPMQPQRGGLFQRLFGPRQFTAPPGGEFPGFFREPKKKKAKKSAEPPVATVEVAPKDPKARKVLVIGDFVGGAVAWGLDQAFADEPRLVVKDLTNDASGLVRADFYDWNKALPEILNSEKPDLVVVAIGANDRQQLREGKTRIAIRSEVWETTYRERVTSMVDTLKVYGRPFFWVSAPPVRATAGMNDMSYLNGIFKPPVTAAKGGYFVDIWNGFTNENGRYISSGPDVDGQPRQLRTGDGINFTKAGRLKLAFYVEREIRRQTGFGRGAADLLASTSGANQIEIAPDGTKRLVGPVISLNDPLPGASDQLAGGQLALPPAPGPETAQFRAIVQGEALKAVAGRVDDFTWPPTQRDMTLFRFRKGIAPQAAASALSEVPIPAAAN